MDTYAVTYQTPPDEFDPGGPTTIVVTATNEEQAVIKANVMYYGETRPTCKPAHKFTVTKA